MDEVRPGEKYELVFTILKGGAFARYRCGDMYRCVGLENRDDETRIPRFEYVDRVPWIIDIAGFTRISENGIRSVIGLSSFQSQIGLQQRNIMSIIVHICICMWSWKGTQCLIRL